MLALAGIAVGLAIGFAMGGSLVSVGKVRMRGEVWIVILFVTQALARGRLADGLPHAGAWATAVWIACSLAILALLLLNRKVRGLLTLALGLAMNLAVVLANGAMPIAAGRATFSSRALPPMYEKMDAATRLPWLADTLRFHLLTDHYLVSIGDVVLAVGAAVFVAAAMRAGTSQH